MTGEHMTGQVESIWASLNKSLLVTGAALIAAGGVVAAAGIGCCTYAAVTAAREWSRSLPTPPNEMARRKLNQARAAGGAAAQAWRTSAPPE
ncbi:MAG: hypothetical protein ACLGIA_09390 [Actinomycetes bacterium]